MEDKCPGRHRTFPSSEHVPPHLLDEQATHEIVDTNNFMKVLGIEWNAELDCFLSNDLLSVASGNAHKMNLSLRHR